MLHLDTTGPTRRDENSRDMSYIPPEIYLKIWDHFPLNIKGKERSELLRNLSQVCRLFCTISRPYIFEKLVLEWPLAPDSFSTAFMHQRDVHAHYLARFVKDLTLRPTGGSAVGVEQLPPSLLPTLDNLPNVRTLTLQMTHLSIDLIQWITQLNDLQTLNILGDFTLAESDGKDASKPVLHLRPSVRIAWHSESVSQLNADPFGNPHHRALLGPNLVILRTGSKPLVEWMVNSKLDFHIQQLDLGEVTVGLAPLYNFLSATPSITQFTIMKIRHNEHPSYPEPNPKMLPNLRGIKCSAPMLPLFSDHRPLTYISLQPMQYHLNPANQLHSLTDLSACVSQVAQSLVMNGNHLVTLEIPVTFFRQLSGYSDVFPCLKTLGLIYFHPNLNWNWNEPNAGVNGTKDSLLSLLRPGPRLFNVETLWIASEYTPVNKFDLVFQYELLLGLIEEFFPSVSAYTCIYSWQFTDGTWEPHIPSHLMESCNEALKELKAFCAKKRSMEI